MSSRKRKMAKGAAQDRARGNTPGGAGGRVVPIAHVAPPLDPSLSANSPAEQFFGPLEPMRPTAPLSVAGRRNDFTSGWNLSTRPRTYEPVSFEELRFVADSYDLLRIGIEAVKNKVSRAQWSIRPRDEDAPFEGTDLEKQAKDLQKLLRRPDKRQFWPDWIKSIVEDMLVTDAATIHVRRTVGGDIYALDQLDGATIKPVIDAWGRQPEPPYAAYQQVLKGLPAINYSTDELVYRPSNLRVHKFYGYSRVEQVLMTINIAIRRQIWQLQYFTDGNIPDSLIGVPSTWTPDQIRIFQDWFDGINSQTAERRKARFVPGEVAKSYIPTKEAEMFGAAEEWLGRVICWCLGLSPHALTKGTNRAEAETHKNEAEEDGLAPIMEWVKGTVDILIELATGSDDLHLVWADAKELDPKVQMEVLTGFAGKAAITANEMRVAMGKDPVSDCPEADQLGIVTLTGFVPLSVDQQIESKQKMQDAFPPPPPPTMVGPDGKPIAQPNNGGKSPPAPSSSVGGGGGGKGGAPVGKSTVAAPPEPHHSVQRPAAVKARNRITKSVQKALYACEASVRDQLLDARKLAKGDTTHGDGESNDDKITAVGGASGALSASEAAEQADLLAASLDLSSLDVLQDAIQPELFDVASTSSKAALAQVGAPSNSQLIGQLNERAATYSETRSAELVGKRVLSDGTVIDNPNAEWSITDTTRNMIRDLIEKTLKGDDGWQSIADALEEDFAFSPSRADTIARTEVAFANAAGASEARASAVDLGINLGKRWILGPDPCEICQENADAGVIDNDDDFPSGDDDVPAHPKCECDVIGVVQEDDE